MRRVSWVTTFTRDLPGYQYVVHLPGVMVFGAPELHLRRGHASIQSATIYCGRTCRLLQWVEL